METTVYTEKFVPQIYKESRDFRVFLKLIDMIVTTTRYEIDNWIKLYDPMECPEQFLELLADFVGYEYNNKLSIAESRIIIANFVQLLKNRGSKLGYKQATSILLNAKLASDPDNEIYKESVNQLEFLETFFDEESGKTTLYFPKPIDYNKDLYDYIRPVGTYLDLKLAEFPSPESDVAVSARAAYNKHSNFDKFDDETTRVNKAQVNLSQMSMKKSDEEEIGVCISKIIPAGKYTIKFKIKGYRTNAKQNFSFAEYEYASKPLQLAYDVNEFSDWTDVSLPFISHGGNKFVFIFSKLNDVTDIYIDEFKILDANDKNVLDDNNSPNVEKCKYEIYASTGAKINETHYVELTANTDETYLMRFVNT